MHFFNKRFYRHHDIWRWFLVTILPASLPFIVSVITSANRLSGDFGEYIRIDELIFMGLSVNISNLNISSARIPAGVRDKTTFLSVGYLLVLSICLGSSYSSDKLSTVGSLIAGVFAALSVVNSLEMNLVLDTISRKNPKKHPK